MVNGSISRLPRFRGYLLGEAFLTICTENAYQISERIFTKYLFGVNAGSRPYAFQRRIVRIGESPLRLVNLQTRQSQIHEHGVYLVDPLIIKHLREIVECGVHGYEAVGKTFHPHSLRASESASVSRSMPIRRACGLR